VINNLRELPFPKLIGPRDRKDLVGLVDRMTSLQEELRSAKSEHQRAVTNRMVSEVDGKIDALVTRLFNVNETVSATSAPATESDA
jgi:hypothetical protein